MGRISGKVAAVVLGLPALALVLAALVLLLRGNEVAPITIAPPPSSSAAANGPTNEIRVHVSGAVVRPDVYTMRPEDRVLDAIAAAGGPTDDADLTGINLARRVNDEDHYQVPSASERAAASQRPAQSPDSWSPVSVSSAINGGGPIDLNRASANQLQSLPGIGPALSAAIVEFREGNGPFTTVDDIVEVPRIGPKTLASIRELVTVSGTP